MSDKDADLATFREALVQLNSAASDAGVPGTNRALWLMVTALSIADANIPGGCSESQFVSMARAAHESVRASLTTGAQS